MEPLTQDFGTRFQTSVLQSLCCPRLQIYIRTCIFTYHGWIEAKCYEVKVKLSLYLTVQLNTMQWIHTGSMDLPPPFLTLALDRGEESASCLCHFTSGGTQSPFYKGLGGLQRWSRCYWEEKNLLPLLGIRPSCSDTVLTELSQLQYVTLKLKYLLHIHLCLLHLYACMPVCFYCYWYSCNC